MVRALRFRGLISGAFHRVVASYMLNASADTFEMAPKGLEMAVLKRIKSVHIMQDCQMWKTRKELSNIDNI